MQNPWGRWAVLIGGMVLATAIAWMALPFLQTLRGVPGPVSESIHPASAAIALVAVFALNTVVAAIVGKLLNAVVGLFTLGIGMGVLAMRTGSIRDACFSGGSMTPLAIESLVGAVAVGIASLLVFRVAGPLPDTEPHEQDRDIISRAFSGESLRMAATGVVALIVIWLLVTSALKGQSLGAVVAGGYLVGNVGRKVSPGRDPLLLFCTPILAGGVAQLILSWNIADPATAFARGTIPGLLAPMPLDLISGTLVGVALGFGFSRPMPAAAGESQARPHAVA